jgi:nuclear pore complex protein Nup62
LGLGGITPATQAVTATTTTTPTVPPTGSLTYAQLEDSINKWTIDLEEQGKFFINQAKQLNAWDNLLVSNSDKILALNETIERVKQQQKQLDQELDFVLAQQNELDELSLPLEKQLADIPVTDQNRFQTYQLSEIIDSQLKQMSEDLKEIVEHLNESNKNEDISDPVIQVSRILNAHMNSLQWIDRNTSQICSHLNKWIWGLSPDILCGL